jgi:hypothetical protein
MKITISEVKSTLDGIKADIIEEKIKELKNISKESKQIKYR